MDTNPKSFIDKFVGGCFSVLVGATALFIAARLIVSVWSILVTCFIAGLVITMAVIGYRIHSNRGW